MEAGELFLGAVFSKAPHAAHEALLTLLPLPVQSRGKTRYRNHPGKPPGTRINSDVGNGMPRNPVPNPGDQPYNAGSDGRIRVYIGCSHPIQTQAPGHQVNQEPIQTRWPNARATEFESVNDSLGGPAPEFESDGRIRYKLGCNHPSQLFWQWCHWALDGTTAFAYFLITPTHNTHHKTQPIPCTPPSADIQLHLRESAPPGFDMASTPHLTTHNLALLQSA
ncbi:hypothetical protein PCASD_03095 [Puccinia coronata f. sp. avenae]|uniref:Uncharacterized protein n=1 Tax=Puccinia coronata f. sp. avenae TaxID=200324 RepID=A0A2N5V5V5_9BASI|nr:hypothetical protein PCASD_03095 [Puccinia coronata f. sp. avenae]